jgi:hypothetical protein
MQRMKQRPRRRIDVNEPSKKEKLAWLIAALVIAACMTLCSTLWLIGQEKEHGAQFIQCAFHNDWYLELPSVRRYWELPFSGIPGAVFVALIYKIYRTLRVAKSYRNNVLGSAALQAGGLIIGLSLVSSYEMLFKDMTGLALEFLLGLAIGAALFGSVGVLYGLLWAIVGALFFGPLFAIAGAAMFGTFIGFGIMMVGDTYIHVTQSYFVGSILFTLTSLPLYLYLDFKEEDQWRVTRR